MTLMENLIYHFTCFLPKWTLIALLTLVGICTLKSRRNMDRAGMANELLLLGTNLDFVISVKIVAVSANIAENDDGHDGFLL